MIIPSNVSAAQPVAIRGATGNGTMPSYQAGDLLVWSQGTNSGVPATPSGWTSFISGGAAFSGNVCYKIATSSETHPGSGPFGASFMIAFSGGVSVGSRSGMAGFNGGSVYIPSITMQDTSGNSMVIGMDIIGNNNLNLTLDGFTTLAGTAQFGVCGYSRTPGTGVSVGTGYHCTCSFEIMNH